MQIYIPEPALNNVNNMQKIQDILNNVPDTDLHFPDSMTLDEAVKQIRELGENKVADLIGGDNP